MSMKIMQRTSKEILTELDALRDRRYLGQVTEVEYQQTQLALWDDLRSADRNEIDAFTKHCRRIGEKRLDRYIQDATLDNWKLEIVANEVAKRQEVEREVAERQRWAAVFAAMTIDDLINCECPVAYDSLRRASIRKLALTVAKIAMEMGCSGTTVRRRLHTEHISPILVEEYTCGWGSYRKDVVAHYYHPNVVERVKNRNKPDIKLFSKPFDFLAGLKFHA